MDKFILVSLDENKKVLKESVDLFELVDASFLYKRSSSLQESIDTLIENGHRIIIPSQTPFLYESALHEASLKDIWTKAKEKLGIGEGDKEEFEKWYEAEKAKRQAAGTWNPVGASKRRLDSAPSTPKSVFNVGGTASKGQPYSRRNRTEAPAVETAPKQKISGEELEKYKTNAGKILKTAKTILNKLFDNDKAAFDEFLLELKKMEESFEKKSEDLAKI